MKQTLKIIGISALATAALIRAIPAWSDTLPPQNVSIVRTADLDLSTARGRNILEHRLVIAAFEVCGAAADVDIAGQNEVRRCRADVLARARAESQQLASGTQSIRIAAGR